MRTAERPRLDLPRRTAAPLWRSAFLLAVSLCLGAGRAQAQSSLELFAAPILAGDPAQVEASLGVEAGQSIAALSLELVYDPGVLLFDDVDPLACAVDPALAATPAPDKDLLFNLLEPGRVLVQIFGLNNHAIPGGPIFSCELLSDPNGPTGSFPIRSQNVIASTPGPGASGVPITNGMTTLVISAAGTGSGICGDVNDDGTIDSLDVSQIRDWLAGGPALIAPDQCSVIGDGQCDIADVSVLIRHLNGLGPGPQPVCPAAQP